MDSIILQAIKDNELQAYYQPQYDAVTGHIVSAEALVRWIKPDGTVVPPFQFIPEAENSGIVTEIDWHMAYQVCKLLDEQKRNNEQQFPIAVNFSRHHIREENFVQKLVELTDQFHIPHELFEVEITESAMVNEEEKILGWINGVRNAGFSVAIDDFGSGLSSLQFVKDMPADILKIDKSLLSHNCENEKERIVLESIFYFANRLKLTTIAEGVETKEQLGFMKTCGCNRIQGYLFAKPMPKTDFLALCRLNQQTNFDSDILGIQSPISAMELLMGVVFRKYPLVIFSNLTRNTYYMMAYENFTSRSCPSTGIFDELIVHGTASMHDEDKKIFSDAFNRLHLLQAHADGEPFVRAVTRQLGDDGIYRRVETTDYFVKSPSSDDVLVITLCDNLE